MQGSCNHLHCIWLLSDLSIYEMCTKWTIQLFLKEETYFFDFQITPASCLRKETSYFRIELISWCICRESFEDGKWRFTNGASGICRCSDIATQPFLWFGEKSKYFCTIALYCTLLHGFGKHVLTRVVLHVEFSLKKGALEQVRNVSKAHCLQYKKTSAHLPGIKLQLESRKDSHDYIWSSGNWFAFVVSCSIPQSYEVVCDCFIANQPFQPLPCRKCS